MGDMYPPTAADYAAHDAREAHRANDDLATRVARLERLVVAMAECLESAGPLRKLVAELKRDVERQP